MAQVCGGKLYRLAESCKHRKHGTNPAMQRWRTAPPPRQAAHPLALARHPCSWNAFLRGTSRLFGGRELCDCYREDLFQVSVLG